MQQFEKHYSHIIRVLFTPKVATKSPTPSIIDILIEIIDLPNVSVFGRAGVAGVLPVDDKVGF